VTAVAQSSSSQQSKGANCSDLELVIARGTTEPLAPTYGIIVGDPLFAATKALIPGLTGYPVNYPADLTCGSRQAGVKDTLLHLNTQAAKCPKQSFVLVGYSQGADVMHYAAANLRSQLYDRIVAVVMFGDPGNRGPKAISPFGGVTPAFPRDLAYKLRENCALGDPVCTNDGVLIPAHLSYNAPDFILNSAVYIKQQFASHGRQGPEPSSPGPDTPTPAEKVALCALGQVLGGGAPQCSTFPCVAATASATAKAAPAAATTPIALVTPAAKMRT